MMSFARTKIQPPSFRMGLIARNELEGKLSAALRANRLVVLTAPAGYGKTAALSRQLSHLSTGCINAWITVDEDDDVPRLITCLAAALEPYDPPWRVAPEALAGQVLEEQGLRRVVEELAGILAAMPVEHGVIALDDVHFVTDPSVHEFLGLLIDVLPDNWTLAIATRTDPPLALARLRLRHELAEFRKEELGFSQDEVQRLCDPLGLDLDGEFARQLHARTEGWAAGVCLSLDALAKSKSISAAASSLGQRQLFDYLAAEVFEQMPQELREFLMRCSVLPEWTVDRCAAVSTHARAAELLDSIERQSLFVSTLDVEPLTLRVHDLFRTFLEDRLRRLHPEEIPLLLARAAQTEPDPVRKLGLLLRNDAFVEAAQVLAEAAPPLLAAGSSAVLARMLDQFPTLVRQGSPCLAYVDGLRAWYEAEDVGTCQYMQRAADGFEQLGLVQQALEAKAFAAIGHVTLGQVDQARALQQSIRSQPMTLDTELTMSRLDLWIAAADGRAGGAAERLGRLVDLLSGGGGAPADLWYRNTPRLYLLVGRIGMDAALQRFVRGALAAAGVANEPLRLSARMLEAWLLLWQGDVAGAKLRIEQLEADSGGSRQPRSLREPMLQLLASYHAIRGDTASVRADCNAMLTDLPPAAVDCRAALTCFKGRLAAAVGDWMGVQEALADLKGPRGPATGALVEGVVNCLEAIHALHENRDRDASGIFKTHLGAIALSDRLGLEASVRIHLAVADLRAGLPNEAWQVLEPVIDRVSASGGVGAVLLAGHSVLSELAYGRWDDATPATGIAALRKWSELARMHRLGDKAPGAESVDAAVARLSGRELEVLALLAQGRSNKLIARALDLSPHTVKRHVARILDRLEMASRGQAAAWFERHRPKVVAEPCTC